MPITLVTGTPGAGKTLYTLAKLAPKFLAEEVEIDGRKVPRTLHVAGVRDLMIEHEPIDRPHITEWETYRDEWSGMQRAPGEPPLDVPHRADNWHLWCQPGDVIIVDEAQYVFRPAAAGRKLPKFVDALNVHRHYGVDFVLITQGPQLIHTIARSLVSPHIHIRRVFGTHTCQVLEWDRASNVNQAKTAVHRTWRHDKKAYSVYKSAEVHTKFGQRIPYAVIALGLALLLLPYLWWRAIDRTIADKPAAKPATVQEPLTHADPLQPGEKPPVARFIAARGAEAFPDAVAPRRTWPEAVAGCWAEEGGACTCVTQEQPPRSITDRPAMCLAVVSGDLVPPASHPTPERVEPTAPAAAASAVGGGA